jgi:hypothetical protein
VQFFAVRNNTRIAEALIATRRHNLAKLLRDQAALKFLNLIENVAVSKDSTITNKHFISLAS